MDILNFIKQEDIDILAKEYKNQELIPFIGAGFSKNIKDPLPDWNELVQLFYNEIKKDKNISKNLALLIDYNDYISALTLIKRQHIVKLDERVKDIIKDKTKNLSADDLPVHQAFWGCNWRAVVTTNFDDLLEKSTSNIRSISYKYPYLDNEFYNTSHNSSIIRTVFHLHGRIDDTGADRLILTWIEYFEAYGINSFKLKLLIKILTKNNLKNKNYNSIVKMLLREEAYGITKDKNFISMGLPKLIGELLSRYTLLFIDFSLDDPFWQIMQWYIMFELNNYIPRRHFILVDDDDYNSFLDKAEKINLGKFSLINIKDYKYLGEFFYYLGSEFTSKLFDVMNPEIQGRSSRYNHIDEYYSDFSVASPKKDVPKWLYEKNGKILPVIELWNNFKDLSLDIAIEYDLSKIKKFKLSENMLDIRDLYWNFMEKEQQTKVISGESEPLINEIKVRINEYKILNNNRLWLEVEPAEYKDYIITNHYIANMNEIEQVRKIDDKDLAHRLEKAYLYYNRYDPRKYLCNKDNAIISSNSLCSNHLGISTILLGEYRYPNTSEADPVLICVPSRGQISSSKEIVPTASGSADWPLLENAIDLGDIIPVCTIGDNARNYLKLERQIWRELLEECFSKYDPKDKPLGERQNFLFNCAEDIMKRNYIKECILLNFCQNIERGGNPELFYLMTLKISVQDFIKYLYPNWEIKRNYYPIKSWTDLIGIAPSRRLINFMPSPLDTNLTPSRFCIDAQKYLEKIIRDDTHNTILKAHICSIMRYCVRKYPKNFL